MADDLYFERNSQWLLPGDHDYATKLSGEEEQSFRNWVVSNKVPFDPNEGVSDYDMRGFWKGLQTGDPDAQSAVNSNDQQLHYPDKWKTPYHQTFSNESQWADPNKAPAWNEKDQLVLPSGQVVFDEKKEKIKRMLEKLLSNIQMMQQLKAVGAKR